MKIMLQTNKAIKYAMIPPKLNNVVPIWLVKYILIFFSFIVKIDTLLGIQHCMLHVWDHLAEQNA